MNSGDHGTFAPLKMLVYFKFAINYKESFRSGRMNNLGPSEPKYTFLMECHLNAMAMQAETFLIIIFCYLGCYNEITE